MKTYLILLTLIFTLLISCDKIIDDKFKNLEANAPSDVKSNTSSTTNISSYKKLTVDSIYFWYNRYNTPSKVRWYKFVATITKDSAEFLVPDDIASSVTKGIFLTAVFKDKSIDTNFVNFNTPVYYLKDTLNVVFNNIKDKANFKDSLEIYSIRLKKVNINTLDKFIAFNYEKKAPSIDSVFYWYNQSNPDTIKWYKIVGKISNDTVTLPFADNAHDTVLSKLFLLAKFKNNVENANNYYYDFKNPKKGFPPYSSEVYFIKPENKNILDSTEIYVVNLERKNVNSIINSLPQSNKIIIPININNSIYNPLDNKVINTNVQTPPTPINSGNNVNTGPNNLPPTNTGTGTNNNISINKIYLMFTPPKTAQNLNPQPKRFEGQINNNTAVFTIGQAIPPPVRNNLDIFVEFSDGGIGNKLGVNFVINRTQTITFINSISKINYNISITIN